MPQRDIFALPALSAGAAQVPGAALSTKLTSSPVVTVNGNRYRLVTEFGDRGAVEVLLQTCTFAFMNRFTDGLMLPSEDEAIKVYHETYGTSTGPLSK